MSISASAMSAWSPRGGATPSASSARVKEIDVWATSSGQPSPPAHLVLQLGGVDLSGRLRLDLRTKLIEALHHLAREPRQRRVVVCLGRVHRLVVVVHKLELQLHLRQCLDPLLCPLQLPQAPFDLLARRSIRQRRLTRSPQPLTSPLNP